MEKLSANPLIDSTGVDNDPMAGMELDQLTGDSLEPCPAPCTLNSQESEYYIVIHQKSKLLVCIPMQDKIGTFCLFVTLVLFFYIDMIVCKAISKNKEKVFILFW